MNPAQQALLFIGCGGFGLGAFVALGAIAIERDYRMAKFAAVFAGASAIPVIVLAVVL